MLLLLALILLLTPTGRPPSSRWRPVAYVSSASAGSLVFSSLLSTRRLKPAFQSVTNPLGVPKLSGVVAVIGVCAVFGLVGSVVASAASLVVRFSTATGGERTQLRWIALVPVPVPVLVVGTAVASTTGHTFILNLLASLLVTTLPVGAAISITQYHLYNVDQLLSSALKWVVLSIVVVACDAVVVLAVGGSIGNRAGHSQVPTVLGTLAAVSVVSPVRRGLQDWLDRRFQRRRFDAVRVIREFVRHPSPEGTIEDALRGAVGDPSLRVAFWVEDRPAWIGSDGQLAPVNARWVEVCRRGIPVAAVAFDPGVVDRELLEALLDEARPELESARLRAAITLQLVESSSPEAELSLLKSKSDVELSEICTTAHNSGCLLLRCNCAQCNLVGTRTRNKLRSAQRCANCASPSLTFAT